MTEVQGRGTAALNIQRVYETTVTAEELARTLADHFRAQESRHRSTAPAGTAR